MSPYVSLLLLFAFGVVLVGIFLILSHLFSPNKSSVAKMMPYECGFDPIGSTKDRVAVKFYLVAMLFILFDIEVVFLYPWAVLFRKFIAQGMGTFMFVEMCLFLGVLFIGLIYVFRSKALDWDK